MTRPTSITKPIKQPMPIETLRIFCFLLSQGTHGTQGQQEAVPGDGVVAGKRTVTDDDPDPTEGDDVHDRGSLDGVGDGGVEYLRT